jgi:hypothetical protein
MQTGFLNLLYIAYETAVRNLQMHSITGYRCTVLRATDAQYYRLQMHSF